MGEEALMEAEVNLEDALDELELDLDEETIGEAVRSVSPTGTISDTIPDDLQITGVGSVSWQFLQAVAVQLNDKALREALVLRRKLVSGNLEALTTEEVKYMRDTLKKPHPRLKQQGETLVKHLIERDPSDVNRWGWTILCDYLEWRNSRVVGEEDGEFRYQDVIDRGPNDMEPPENAQHVFGAPTATDLRVYGERSPLYAIAKLRPSVKGIENIARMSIVEQAIKNYRPEELTRDEWKYFKDLFEVDVMESGISLPAHTDELWDYLATVRVVTSQYESTKRREQLKPAPQKKSKKKKN